MGTNVDSIDLSVLQQEPAVKGSVQEMYSVQCMNVPCYLARALDEGSVFDVGTFFSIPGSGRSRNTLRHKIFCDLGDPKTWRSLRDEDFASCFSKADDMLRLQRSEAFAALRQQGAATHHLGMVDPGTGAIITSQETPVASDLVLIRAFPVLKPQRIELVGAAVYDYHHYTLAPKKVLALEHVVRLGVPGGSSIYDRYAKLREGQRGKEAAAAFLAAYGLAEPLQPWTSLPHLACDWATKFEDYDRHLTYQEAGLISGVPGQELIAIVDLLLLCTVLVARFFRVAGLQLWDLKWEVADEQGNPTIVDTLDHDSVRITKPIHYRNHVCHIHFNKQAVRDYYRILHPEWHAALAEAKRRSTEDADRRPFMEIYLSGVSAGRYPPIPELDSAFASLQGEKYGFVNDATTGLAEPSLGEELATRELEYYASRGRLREFLHHNAV